MTNAHHGVADGLDRLATAMHLEDTGPFAAFVLAVDGGFPTIYVVSEGRFYPFGVLRANAEAREGYEAATWTFDDLERAARVLNDITSWIGIGQGMQQALAHAKTMDDNRLMWPFERALRAAQVEADNPHVCVCKRRFKTERGMVQHQRTCRKAVSA